MHLLNANPGITLHQVGLQDVISALGIDSTERFLDRSIKAEVKKKHLPCGCNFSCFAAHLMERDLF
jgi:hypothetical protein